MNNRIETIGGSDIGTLFGYNKYCKCVRQLWYSKKEPFQENYHMRRGKLLEPVAVQEYCRQNELNLDKLKYQVPVVSKDMPFIVGTADCVYDNKEVWEIKCKSANSTWDSLLENKSYHVQVELYTQFLGFENWRLIVFCAETATFKVITRETVENLPSVDEIKVKAWEYYSNYVLTDNEPERLPCGSELCKNCQYEVDCMGLTFEEMLEKNKKNKKDREYAEIDVPEYEALKTVKQQIKELENQELELKEKIFDKIGTNNYVNSNGTEFTACVQSREVIDYKAYFEDNKIEIPEQYKKVSFSRAIR
jgi:predicted phage-related endonuclease